MAMSRKWWEPGEVGPCDAPERNDGGILDPAGLMMGGMHGWLLDACQHRMSLHGMDGSAPPKGGMLRRFAALISSR